MKTNNTKSSRTAKQKTHRVDLRKYVPRTYLLYSFDECEFGQHINFSNIKNQFTK